MSDQKTYQAETVRFGDRLSVSAECACYCLGVALVWSVGVLSILTKEGFLAKLVLLSPPLIATGVLTLLGGLVPGLVTSTTLRFPLNITTPVIWGLISFLTVSLMSTQESTTTMAPEQMRPIFVWTNPVHFLPVVALQVIVISIPVLCRRSK